MPNVSAVIPNFNGERLLRDCLRSLEAQRGVDLEVIVVDDGSTDRSIATVREILPTARIIALPQNRGFAAAANAGMASATGDYVFLLNNDTEIESDCIARLLEAAEGDASIGMVAPKILNWFDRSIIDSVGGLLITPDAIGNGRGRGETDRGQYDEAREVLLPSGCAAMYRRTMLDEIGLFDEEFFAYCEDSDLGLRARWAGWRARSAPKAIVYHKYSQTAGAHSAQKLYLVERNHFFVAFRTFPLGALIQLPFWSLFRYAVMLYAAVRGRGRGEAVAQSGLTSLLAAMGRAWRDGLRELPRQIGRRAKLRRISAGEFRTLLWRHRLTVPRLVLTA